MFWLYLLYYVLLMLISLAGLAISVLGLPGLWLMVAAAVGFSLATGGSVLGWQAVAVVAALALGSEIAEFLAGAAGSKNAGGTWRGVTGAVVGGIAGGIIGVPVPIVGPVLGAILGAAIGAGMLELAGGKASVQQAGNIAVGAAKGRFWGTVSKLAFGSVMFFVLAVYAFPLPGDLPESEEPATVGVPQPAADPWDEPGRRQLAAR